MCGRTALCARRCGPLPLWWVLISVGAFMFGVVYLLLYPGFGNFAGNLGWSSQERTAAQRRRQQRTARGAAGAAARRSASSSWRRDKDAVAIGHRLYLDNCAACHGREALGNHAVGAPDLTDADWLYGGDAETILTSILDGRNGVMPPLEGALGHNGVNEVAVVCSQPQRHAGPAGLDRGGQDALRRPVRPPVTARTAAAIPPSAHPICSTSAWLYGGSIESVVESVRDGRNGVMPAWRQRLIRR